MNNPLPWWTSRDAAAHTAWTASQEPAPVPWELLDCCQQWAAGQPVLLSTSGQEHVAYVRLCGATFTPRWLPPAGAIHRRRVHPAALTTRNPRGVWSNAFVLQAGLALLAAQRSPDSWLAGPYSEDEGALQELLETATEELARRSAPAFPPSGPVPATPPKPRRGWTRTEVEGLRVPEGVIEPVAFTPGK